MLIANQIFFWLFACLSIGFALNVILQKNALKSALSLVFCFISIAVIYVLLNAFFIGIVQVLVYAGAIMVLFLFIIMFLNLDDEKVNKPQYLFKIASVAVTILFVIPFITIFSKENKLFGAFPKLASNNSDVKEIGKVLLFDYPILLQIVALILLVGVIGICIVGQYKNEN